MTEGPCGAPAASNPHRASNYLVATLTRALVSRFVRSKLSLTERYAVRLLLCLPALGAAASAMAASGDDVLPGPVPAAVERVVDGDTLAVRAQIWVGMEVAVMVRLADIQAPELRRADCAAEREAGEAARAALAADAGHAVSLADIRHGVYAGRVIARVLSSDGADIGARLIAQGHAVAYGDVEPWCAS